MIQQENGLMTVEEVHNVLSLVNSVFAKDQNVNLARIEHDYSILQQTCKKLREKVLLKETIIQGCIYDEQEIEDALMKAGIVNEDEHGESRHLIAMVKQIIQERDKLKLKM